MSFKYKIFWNDIELLYLSPDIEDWDINEDFDFEKKIFTITKWIQNLIILNEEKEIKSQILFYSIIKKIRYKAKETRLDYLQKLYINNKLCWLIDNWENICLMLPSEY